MVAFADKEYGRQPPNKNKSWCMHKSRYIIVPKKKFRYIIYLLGLTYDFKPILNLSRKNPIFFINLFYTIEVIF